MDKLRNAFKLFLSCKNLLDNEESLSKITINILFKEGVGIYYLKKIQK